MITIISGSNRADNETAIFSSFIYEEIRSLTTEKVWYIDLTDFPWEEMHNGMYDKNARSSKIAQWQNEMLIPSDKFWFIMPEYNGSFPGILKVFIDMVSIYKYKETFEYKKAALTGIATGRAGNLRGMDHFADILNHMGVIVHPNKLPVSRIHDLLSEMGEIMDKATKTSIQTQIHTFLTF